MPSNFQKLILINFLKTLSKTNFIKTFILSFLTILLLCLSLPPADQGYLAWIAFIPWFILFVSEERHTYLSALFIGAVFIFIQLSWLRHVTYIALIQICYITGVNGVSFIIIMVNAGIVDLIIYAFTKRNLLICETEKRR